MWNDGYVSEIDYVFGYVPEMSLPQLKFALLSRRVGHNVGTSPNYLELGFGQGMTLAINAATGSGTYYGTDFNPGQAANAIRFAEASGKPVHIFDQGFEQLAARTDLPEFDVIALHGIWSWVSDKARESILQIVNERLKPGGIVYISHNVLPGWSPLVPLRKLIFEHYNRAGTGPLAERLEESLGFAAELRKLGVGYFGAQPAAANWIDVMHEYDRHYLAHEYLNAQWRPETFADLADRLADVKLRFGASAKVHETLAEKFMPAEVKATLEGIDDPTLRELTKDYLVNRRFRADIFVKGGHTLSNNEVWDMICGYSFVRPGFVTNLPTTLDGNFGKIDLRADMFAPLVETLDASEGSIASFVELRTAAVAAGMTDDLVIDAVTALVSSGYLMITTDSDTVAEDFFASLRFNREICRQARYHAQPRYLAAPGINSGIKVDRIQLLILHAMASGFDDIAEYVLETLERQGEALRLDGQRTDDPAPVLKAIEELVVDVRTSLLPRLEGVGAVATTVGNPFAVPAIDCAAIDPIITQAFEAGGVLQAGA